MAGPIRARKTQRTTDEFEQRQEIPSPQRQSISNRVPRGQLPHGAQPAPRSTKRSADGRNVRSRQTPHPRPPAPQNNSDTSSIHQLREYATQQLTTVENLLRQVDQMVQCQSNVQPYYGEERRSIPEKWKRIKGLLQELYKPTREFAVTYE